MQVGVTDWLCKTVSDNPENSAFILQSNSDVQGWAFSAFSGPKTLYVTLT